MVNWPGEEGNIYFERMVDSADLDEVMELHKCDTVSQKSNLEHPRWLLGYSRQMRARKIRRILMKKKPHYRK